jgi:hypothetical protein
VTISKRINHGLTNSYGSQPEASTASSKIAEEDVIAITAKINATEKGVDKKTNHIQRGPALQPCLKNVNYYRAFHPDGKVLQAQAHKRAIIA